MSVLESAAALRSSTKVRIRITTDQLHRAFDRLEQRGIPDDALDQAWERLLDGLGDVIDDLDYEADPSDDRSLLPPDLAAAVRVNHADAVVTTDEQLIGQSLSGAVVIDPDTWLQRAEQFLD